MEDDSVSGFVADSFEGLEHEFTNVTVERRTSCNILARARRFGRWWLLKGLLPELRNDARYQTMLRKELSLMMRVQHPGVVQATSLEEVEGLGPCIIMEYVDGWTLKEWLMTNPSGEERRKVAKELVDVVAYLHRLGIVHRDLKPSNIMVTRNGLNVKLIDFGLADSDAYAVLKQPGGTPRYMAPELAEGGKSDVRNDIYSLGVIFSDMHLGTDFDTIVRRCQEPIDRRYHTSDELHSAMDEVFQRSKSRGRWLQLLKVGSALLLLAAIVMGIVWWRNSLPPTYPKDMTYLINNPNCDSDSLDAWTFEKGGRTLSDDGMLMYFMKDFDVYQVVHGLPAGEYELTVRAWGENNEQDIQYCKAEIYAGPFFQRVKNRVEAVGVPDNTLRFVLLEDSVRIGFRSNYNTERYSRVVADDFRLALVRPLASETQRSELESLVDSAQTQDEERRIDALTPKENMIEGHRVLIQYDESNEGIVYHLWRGHEEELPAGWITEQHQDCCHLVNKSDVGRNMGDSDIYLEYLSKEPARPGLLIGRRVHLKPGTYYFGAIYFAHNASGQRANVSFAVQGFNNDSPADALMNWVPIKVKVTEEQDVTVGIWAAPGSDVHRAGICSLQLYNVIEEQ